MGYGLRYFCLLGLYFHWNCARRISVRFRFVVLPIARDSLHSAFAPHFQFVKFSLLWKYLNIRYEHSTLFVFAVRIRETPISRVSPGTIFWICECQIVFVPFFIQIIWMYLWKQYYFGEIYVLKMFVGLYISKTINGRLHSFLTMWGLCKTL